MSLYYKYILVTLICFVLIKMSKCYASTLIAQQLLGSTSCQHQPLCIRNLSIYDATSFVNTQLGNRYVFVPLRYTEDIQTATLVVFKGSSVLIKLAENILMHPLQCVSFIPEQHDNVCDYSKSRNLQSTKTQDDKNKMVQVKHNKLNTFTMKKKTIRQMSRRNCRENIIDGTLNRSPTPSTCKLVHLNISMFDHLQLDGFISGEHINIGACLGACSAPVTFDSRTPNYAELIEIVNKVEPESVNPLSVVRCRPSQLQDFSVMRWINNNIVIQRWPRARVVSCGCGV